MNPSKYWRLALVLLLLGCEDRKYVDPDTVALVVKRAATGVERVNHCNYVPVLLGSVNTQRYPVEGELAVTIDISREAIRVTFESAGTPLEPFEVTPKALAEQHDIQDDIPPDGYTVELSSGCTPDD